MGAASKSSWPTGVACDDGIPCTVGEMCAADVCVGGVNAGLREEQPDESSNDGQRCTSGDAYGPGMGEYILRIQESAAD